MKAAELIIHLASSGRYHFTTNEFAQATGASPLAARAALRRLKRRGVIATPLRGFHVTVPPEYRRLACLPPEQFVPQLMVHLGLDYYVGLLSAAELHGAAHQRPQVFQVLVAKNRPPLKCGQVNVRFIARRNVNEMPVQSKNTPRGSLLISTPESTAFDLVGYSEHCGGLNNVATILYELADSLDPLKLVQIPGLCPVPWAQRLGFLLERVGSQHQAEHLAAYVSDVAHEYVPLRPALPSNEAPRSSRWRLLVNVDVEPDL